MCSSRFSDCPDDVVPGSHNELGHLLARYDSPFVALSVAAPPGPPLPEDSALDGGGGSSIVVVVVVVVVAVALVAAVVTLLHYRCQSKTEAEFASTGPGQGPRKSWHAQEDFDSVAAVAAEQQMRTSLTRAGDKTLGHDPRRALDRQSDSPAADVGAAGAAVEP
eukprot:SAG22_NODE_693_length_7872_cov_13.111797_3_plen_164_part_00